MKNAITLSFCMPEGNGDDFRENENWNTFDGRIRHFAAIGSDAWGDRSVRNKKSLFVNEFYS